MNALTITTPKQIALIEPQQPQLAIMAGHTGKTALTNLAAIYLSRLLRLPIERIQLVERLGRVVVVRYEPYGKCDPVLPIPLLDLGQAFFEGFSAFALHFQEWRSGAYVDEQRQWLTKAYQRLDVVTRTLSEQTLLSQGEYQYLIYQLALSVARPGRMK